MSETCFKVLPTARSYLNYWKIQAQQIPNLELRKQALASIEAKQFHCEGGQFMDCLRKITGRKQLNLLLLTKRLVII